MVELEYAKALYELAVENDKLNEINQNLIDFISVIDTNLDFFKVMISKGVLKQEKKDIICNVFKGFEPMFLDFIYVLLDNNRFDLINNIKKEFEHMVDESNNVMNVIVTSCETLSEKESTRIKTILEEKYNGKIIKINNVVDKSVIGGISVSCDGEGFDMTIKNRLDALKASL